MNDATDSRKPENKGESLESRGGPMPDDPRLFQAVQEYLQQLEQGKRPDRREWLARYPDLADALNECLDGLDFVHHAAASVGSGSSPRPVVEPGPALESSTPVGDFQIVREIGRGGMGIVYEAIQLSLGRRVALKVLPLAASFDAKYLQRFRQEAQAAAQLHHSSIVPVYAVGCERGIHYYAMQLIDGQSLDRIVRQLRSEAGMNPVDAASSAAIASRRGSGARHGDSAAPPAADAPPTPLEPEPLPAASGQDALDDLSADLSTHRSRAKEEVYRTAARLMAQAAEALEYAHQEGIVHRDIKPANLLIDTRRNLWITDFGLAQFHADQGLTRTGDLLGTVRYASPEQVSGQRTVLDHRTDVYSLAATFYELLTLQPVFAGPTRHALLHQVLNQDPVAPRSLQPSIPPELETILLKSLSKIPAERYNSARELADDLQRFLHNEPIRARRPTPLERLRKWGRRHPSFVVAAVAVMFVTLVVSGVSNWLVTQANIRTQAALDAERLRAIEAEQRFSQARKAVDLLIEVCENDLADRPHLEQVRKRLLETALVYYQEFVAQHRGSSASQAELVSVEQRLKRVLDDLSVMEGAGQIILLANELVQADLALTEAQLHRVQVIAREFSEKRRELLHDFLRLPLDQRRSRFLELARTNEQAMRSTLTEQQLKRLGQITLQLHGFLAFTQPDIAEILKLTDAQRQAIRLIEMETFTAAWEEENRTQEQPRREFREALFRTAMEKTWALLTAEQQASWKQLTGEPFQGRWSLRPPGPFLVPEAGDAGPKRRD